MRPGAWVRRALPLVLLFLIATVLWQTRERQPAVAVRVNCTTPASGCSSTLDGSEIRVGIDGVPRPLKPFDVWVRAEHASRVEARFTMEGMDMGFNLYTLRRDASGIFRARVTLPVCVTGRRDWLMTLTIDGKQLAVPFVTEL